MEAWIWIPITFLAAFMQAARTAGQKHLTKDFSAVGASYVRFLWGLPFALVYLWYLHHSGGHDLSAVLPVMGWTYFVFAALTAISQIAATVLLVFLFSLRNFAIGSTYARTEALLTAIVGAVVFHEALAGAGWVAVAMGALGVIMINLARTGVAGETFVRRLFQPAAGVGLLAGLGFAGASLFLRQASLSLGLSDWLYSAALTLALVLIIQTAIMTGYVLFRARDQIAAMGPNWRGCLFVGITSVIGSAGWFTAMTIERAAYVKALGQVELLFTLALSVLFFKERSTPKELLGMALVAGSIIVLLLYG
ncbi:MAG: EamA family transporter [Rhodospirillaceae bacterium]|jgi:drug/metabolite transporter (DMT)-like permease|nr:EamA family transporter [Rhodospirillaceae bacterium]MBT4046561.1 EamA family transporter [Rhodospirillaceae bacterium]MBT4689123.1 EamA family transporter [Rhodospirillaceae bacterium]MBT5079726.1 EamA family transporter [Rhodospirillaceae bacterium]MBT5527287.1 EamA family transporter [Rhodospirillaceae bacterium]